MRYNSPPLWKAASEFRAPAEFVSLMASAPLVRRLPVGDGHPVLVLPGFMAVDASTLPLRRLLRRLGYAVSGWGLGVNVGPRPHVIAGLRRKLEEMAAGSEHGVSIVGWSLGGMYGRVLAQDHPDMVRQLISLASPYRMGEGDTSTATRLYEAMETPDERAMWRAHDAAPLTRPVTALITKLDGIVDWRACVEDDAPLTQTLEVRGASHFGLGHNPAALRVVADRLAQRHGVWQPYRVPVSLRRVIVPVVVAPAL